MLLQSLRLRNIRSYNDETIKFPQGVVLLAGDIGAGKSTILLAIEFGLFGLLRGDLSGTALLRNGSKEGLVELSFTVNDKQVIIGRTLKRTKTSVEQSAGYIIENGLRREATAIELKTAVLMMLGYPADMITKSKSLIYRYTVYTPQEDMKKIILDDPESRLAILRKVFDIEKYRRISDNAAVYAKLLRERKKLFEGQLADEPEKKKHLETKQSQAKHVHTTLLAIQPRLNSAKKSVQDQKSVLASLEKEKTVLNEHRATLQSAETELKTLLKQKQSTESEINMLTPLLAQAPPAALQSPEELAKSLSQKNNELMKAEQSLQTYVSSHAELIAKKKLSEESVQKLMALDQCPTCLQKVDESHKHEFVEKEKQGTQALSTQLSSFESSIKSGQQDKARLQQEIQAIQQQQASVREVQLKQEHYKQNQLRKQKLDQTISEISASLKSAEEKKQKATIAMQGLTAFETKFSAEKQKLEDLQQQEKTVIVEHATLLEQAKLLKETITILEKELETKRQARKNLEKLNSYHQWTAEFFTNLMDVMEKHVLTKVYHDFNSLFQQWFSALIADDVIAAKLDEQFSPLVQQNGYDTDVANLSGGEKTACALAYRLALNKVINALRTSVHTKDILILDEPTDGFSSDQLDRMREVLDQVRAKQIILVSHEAKIESLADHVLRVVKEEHASKVVV